MSTLELISHAVSVCGVDLWFTLLNYSHCTRANQDGIYAAAALLLYNKLLIDCSLYLNLVVLHMNVQSNVNCFEKHANKANG